MSVLGSVTAMLKITPRADVSDHLLDIIDS